MTVDLHTQIAENGFAGPAEIRVPDVGDGEAIIFHGRLWHGTHNKR